MVQQIDFLPAGYHRRRRQTRKRYWRGAVGVAFVALALLGGLQQYRTRVTVRESRDRLQRQADTMTACLADPAPLRGRIEELDAAANLVARLRRQPRTTPVLAAITDALPRFVSLTELRLSRDRIERAASRRDAKDVRDEESTPDVHDDLERLAARDRDTALFVSLQGVAPDDVAISRYLAALEATRLFDEVRLIYTDRYRFRENELRSFAARLRVRPPGTGRRRAAGELAMRPGAGSPAPKHVRPRRRPPEPAQASGSDAT